MCVCDVHAMSLRPYLHIFRPQTQTNGVMHYTGFSVRIYVCACARAQREPDSVSVSGLIRKCCAYVAPFSYPLRAAAAAMSGLNVRTMRRPCTVAPLMTRLPARATIAST